MFEVFKYIDKFFTSLTNYLTYNDIFIIFGGLFLLAAIIVAISTGGSYEAKLIKSIDKFNTYFIDNPHINEDNLVSFNAKMKDKSVPKQLRKSWQQFVLYRENKASSYMSFENCVSNPIKNSSYKRDTKLLNIFAYIFSVCALILNCYYCFETSDLANVLSSVLLTPVIILLANYIIQIFFHIKHSAIVSDLFQNYQYFEVNIDKATETLPEYVDYEILFDRNEIKKGIPILYAYLQKRAEEEQRELERARLKNVEHEKFNFDDTGIEASLVLERAMQEAENYIAERKKYNQDTEHINSDITQEEMNYREITKEYNRQMQVSKETFANFKSQLEEASSTIEANYLKKQQQQELDRQRNLERDYDTATERHKKIIENYQAELDSVDNFIAESRKTLETAMKSEFATYSSKVYDAAKKVVEEREKEKTEKLKLKINDLQEELVVKNSELEKVYAENMEMSEQLSLIQGERQPAAVPVYEEKEVKATQAPTPQEQPDEDPDEDPIVGLAPEYEEQPMEEEFMDAEVEEEEEVPEEIMDSEPEYAEEQPMEEDFADYDSEQEDEEFEFDDDSESEEFDNFDDSDNEEFEFDDDSSEEDFWFFDEEQPETTKFGEEDWLTEETESPVEDEADMPIEEELPAVESQEEISTQPTDDSITKPASNRGRPRKVVDAAQGEKKQRGRPKKVEAQSEVKAEPKKGPGRPKKVEVQPEVKVETKKGPGRPKKVETQPEVKTEIKKGRGRPKKVETEPEIKVETKKGPGRPKKVEAQPEVKVETKKGPGRPKKEVAEEKPVAKKAGRPKKVETQAEVKTEIKKGPGRPKKGEAQPEVKAETKKGPGRPKKEVAEEKPVAKKVGRPKKVEAQPEVKAGTKKGPGRPKKTVDQVSADAANEKTPNSLVDIDEYIKQIDSAIAEENEKLKATQKELAKDSKLRRKK